MHLNKVTLRLSHRLCQAEHSEREAQEIFAKSKELWSASEFMNRHELCYNLKMIFRGFYDRAIESGHVYEPHFGLDLALLTCCRKFYHDAHSLIYSTNTFSFTFPLRYRNVWVHDTFPDTVRMDTFIHRLHLDIIVDYEVVERDWNHSFRYIAGAFRSLRYFHVDIEQRPIDIHTLRKWHFKKPADCTLLKDLSALRVLKLRTLTVTVADDHVLHSVGEELLAEDQGQYRWSMAQKQEWAAYMTRVLLRQED